MIRNVLIVAIAYYIGAELAFLIGTLSDKIFAPFWPPNVVSILRASAHAAAAVVDLHRRCPARPYAGRAGRRHADAAIDRGLRDKLPGCDRKRICRATPDGRAPVVWHHPQDNHLCPDHRFSEPGFLRARRCFRSDFGRRVPRRLRSVLGALVRLQCARQPHARADRHDLHGAHNAAPPRTDWARRRSCHYRSISGRRLHHCV